MPEFKKLDFDAGYMLCKECKKRVFILTPTTELYQERCERCGDWSVSKEAYDAHTTNEAVEIFSK